MRTFLIAACLTMCFGADDRVAQHKAWMDAAQDLKDELQDALDAKAANKVAEAADKLTGIGQREEQYWSKAKVVEGVKLARENLAAAREIAQSAKAGQLNQASKTFAKLNDTCRTCHDLHLEKRR
jgi:hypothetical protein